MADTKDDIVLSIRGMCKSFGRNRVDSRYVQVFRPQPGA